MTPVHVLLPPSETKSAGGTGPPIDLDRLAYPELRATREQLIDAVRLLAADLPAARRALRVPATLDGEIAANGRVLTAGTEPALRRYTGVLYAALHSPALRPAQIARANGRILICSALFGLLTAADRIPSYRLSAGSRLPGLPTLAALWRAPLSAALARLDGPVLDLRSGAYAAFAPAGDVISVRVVTVTRAGERRPVSHDNKAVKGALARVVATTRAEVTDVRALVRVATRAGLHVVPTGPASLDLIAPPGKSVAGAAAHPAP